MDKRDAENILQVKDGYTLSDIKRARNKLASKYHPDVCSKSGMDPLFAGAYMRVINEAADWLQGYAERAVSPISTSVPWNNRDLYEMAEIKLKFASGQEDHLEAAVLFERSRYRDYAERREECVSGAVNSHKASAYFDALKAMGSAATETEYRNAANAFKDASGYRDADSKAEECLNKAERLRAEAERKKKAEAEKRRKEEERKRAVYEKAVATAARGSRKALREAVASLSSIQDWRDSAELIRRYQAEIARLDKEAEQKRLARQYEAAQALLEGAKCAADFEEAAELFAKAGGYKDAAKWKRECNRRAQETRKAEAFATAKKMMERASTEKDYLEASKAFSKIGTAEAYAKKKACEERAKAIRISEDYEKACRVKKTARSASQYRNAAKQFAALDDYKDAWKHHLECRRIAEELDRENEYKAACAVAAAARTSNTFEDAARRFAKLGSYSDAPLMQKKCEEEAKRIALEDKYKLAVNARSAARCKSDYVKVISKFEELGDYKDSSSRLKEAKNKLTLMNVTDSNSPSGAWKRVIALLIVFSFVGCSAYNTVNSADYEVRLVDTSGNVIDSWSNTFSIGQVVYADAPEIDGYVLSKEEPSRKEVVMSKNDSDNVIAFRYLERVPYTVSYCVKGSSKKIAKTVKKTGIEGEKVTLKAKDIDGYALVSDGKKTIVLNRDAYKNGVTFLYKKEEKPQVSYSGGAGQPGSGGTSSNGSGGSSSGSSSHSSDSTRNPFSNSSDNNPFSE